MSPQPVWDRLIRFISDDNKLLYGEPTAAGDVGRLADEGRLEARIVEAGSQGPLGPDSSLSNTVVKVKRLLGPLGPETCTGIKCIGLNYRQHKAKRSLPPYPSLFLKPVTCLADYGEVVTIPKCAQDGEADYEGELCAIIGQDCKDVSVEDALQYVIGYTCGDDLSTRKWQRDKDRAGGVPQWCFSKVISDPSKLHMTVRVNGQERQRTGIDDLLFDVAQIVSFLSQGTTLQRGTVIMTGTPGGVGCTGSEETWRPLRHGDEVEVEIDQIGILRHSITYE